MSFEVEKYFSQSEIWQLKEISSAEIPFSESVVEACRANRCGMYGKTWTCPPGVGELSELERKIKSYRRAVVYSCKFELEDSFDYEGMMAGGKSVSILLRKILTELRADGVPHMALGCEGCGLCEKCTYPDAPCRHPELAIPSVEACGINVVELSRNIDIKYNNGPNTVTYFCIVLFDKQA